MDRPLSSFQDYRSVLLREYEQRCQRNSHYSQRAFARDLKISPSRLSEVLRGRYGLSAASARQVAQLLGYSPSEEEYFVALVESEHARSGRRKRAAQEKLALQRGRLSFSELELETFQVISHWYHYAILELTYCKDFRSNAAWIAKRLGIPLVLTQQALKRLKNLGFLVEKSGRLQCQDDFMDMPSGKPSETIRKFHAQILQKTQEALQSQGMQERHSSAAVMAIQQDKLPAARRMLEDFRRDFCQVVGGESDRSKDAVYCLSVHFFNLLESLPGENQ